MKPNRLDKLCEVCLSHSEFMRDFDTDSETGLLFSKLTIHVMRSYITYAVLFERAMLLPERTGGAREPEV